eukprot:scaffold506596_cov37-Prasinocladus_malaysianus.AAC.1
MAAAHSLPKLKALEIHTHYPDDALATVGPLLPRLESLTYHGAESLLYGQLLADMLAKATRLTALDFSVHGNTPAVQLALASLPASVTRLSLSTSHSGPEGFLGMLGCCSSLTDLSLKLCYEVIKGELGLALLPNLTGLTFHRNYYYGDDLNCLAEIPSLRGLQKLVCEVAMDISL